MKGVAVQITAIVIAAAGAAGFAFFQSLAAQTGVCPAPTMSPEEVGLLGAGLKSAHSAFYLVTHQHPA